MSKLDDLITELCPEGVEYKKLSELFNTRNGYTPSKSNTSFWENGTIPWFRMEDIRINGGILTKARKYVSKEAVKGKPFPANSIIISTSATIGEYALVTVESLANQRFTNLTLKEKFQKSFIPKFLYYYCFIVIIQFFLIKAAINNARSAINPPAPPISAIASLSASVNLSI